MSSETDQVAKTLVQMALNFTQVLKEVIVELKRHNDLQERVVCVPCQGGGIVYDAPVGPNVKEAVPVPLALRCPACNGAGRVVAWGVREQLPEVLKPKTAEFKIGDGDE